MFISRQYQIFSLVAAVSKDNLIVAKEKNAWQYLLLISPEKPTNTTEFKANSKLNRKMKSRATDEVEETLVVCPPQLFLH
mmetsp:Transcript_16534/g.34117  ORF Transcript_16534/g.34117 Transcript_16534/m.34117 type:complete len:80 (+) Transcript_16534:554-793(+)